MFRIRWKLWTLVMVMITSACGVTASDGDKEPPQNIGEGEGKVSIVAWPGYIERGATDPAYDWVTQFEKDTGCLVEVTTAATSDEMVALMNEGSFDLVTASGDASLRLIAGGTAQKINTDIIPSWNTVDVRLKNAPWHKVDGEHYGVPYQWGPNVLLYNTDVFGDQPPSSWGVVFEEQTFPDGQSNKGRVQAYVGPIYIADAALYLKTHNPELEIVDPYELKQDQFDAAVTLLKQQRRLVKHYWHDTDIQVEDFKNEKVVASSSWPYQMNLLARAGFPVASLIPAEGTTGWADTTLMRVDAPHPNCAYKWLEWSLNPKLQGDLASWFGSLPVVPKACEGNDLLGPDGCKSNGYGYFDQIAFWKTPVADCGDGSQDCIPYDRWTSTYLAIMGGQ